MNSDSLKEIIENGSRQFEIGHMKKAMDLFEDAKSRIELEMKQSKSKDYSFEYVSVVIKKLCRIYYLKEQKELFQQKQQKQQQQQESSQNSKRLYIDILFSFAKTFSKAHSLTKERKQAWNECLEYAEKSFGKLSRAYLQVLETFPKPKAPEEPLINILKEIEKEFELKPESKETSEYAFCLYLIAKCSEKSQEQLDYCSRAIEIDEKLYGKHSLPVLLQNQLKIMFYAANDPRSKERTNETLALEESLRELIGIRHPKYLNFFMFMSAFLLPHTSTTKNSIDPISKFEELIEAPKKPKRTDCKEASILFDEAFWDFKFPRLFPQGQAGQPDLAALQALVDPFEHQLKTSFRLFRIHFWLSYSTFGLFHSTTITSLSFICKRFTTFIPQKIPLCRLLWALVEPRLEDFFHEYIQVTDTMISLLSEERKWDEAVEIVEQVKSLISKRMGDRTIEFAGILKREGDIYFKQEEISGLHKYEKSWPILSKSIALYEEILKEGEQNFSTLGPQFHYFGQTCELMGKYDKALEYYEKARYFFQKLQPHKSDTSDELRVITSEARNVMLMLVSEKTYKDDEEKRDWYLKAFTGKYSAEKCIDQINFAPVKDLVDAHVKCKKPLPFSTITFTEGFVQILKQVNFRNLNERRTKVLKEMCISVLHHLIAPDVIVSQPKDLGRICVVPLKVAVDTLRMVRLLKSSMKNELKLGDRKRVILLNILETIGMRNEIPNGTKFFERIFNFGIDRKTFGQSRLDFYVKAISGNSIPMLKKYHELLIDANDTERAKSIQNLLNPSSKQLNSKQDLEESDEEEEEGKTKPKKRSRTRTTTAGSDKPAKKRKHK